MVDILNATYLITSVGNVFLLLILLYIFVQDYMQIKSKFTLGLVIFAGIMLLNALFSCSFIHSIFTPGCFCLYDPLHTFTSVTEFFALIVLIYIVSK